MNCPAQHLLLATIVAIATLSSAGCTVMPHGNACHSGTCPSGTCQSCNKSSSTTRYAPGADCGCGQPRRYVSSPRLAPPYESGAAFAPSACGPSGWDSNCDTACGHCAGLGCGRCRPDRGAGDGLTISGGLKHLRKTQEKLAFPVAPKSPIPTFHPVPTRPVFEASTFEPISYPLPAQELLPAPPSVPTPAIDSHEMLP